METRASWLTSMFSWRHSPALRPEGSSLAWQWRRGSCRTLCRSCQRGHCRRSVGRCMLHPHRPGHPQHLALASPWRSREWRLRPAVSVGLWKGLQCIVSSLSVSFSLWEEFHSLKSKFISISDSLFPHPSTLSVSFNYILFAVWDLIFGRNLIFLSLNLSPFLTLPSLSLFLPCLFISSIIYY